MSSLPLVNVTARINDQQGRPVSGAIVKMRLTTVEKYQGIVVPRETMQVTDAAGVAILRVFPNALGYEGSEYDVHITFPGSNSGVCGSHAPSSPALRAIRAHAVVPNSNCNLLDILNLPPYEQRGAGAVLGQEVAGYASEAASHADAARSSAQAAEASKGVIIALKDAAEAAKTAAQASASQSAIHAQQSKQNADRADAVVCEFENIVNTRVEDTAQRLTAKATACIKEQGAVSLNAIEQRSSDVLLDFTTAATEARAGAVAAIIESKENALHAVDDAKLNALDDLKEVGAEYEEDFVALVERAEGAAKRAGCSSAGAANSAAKACACAEDAKTAAQGLERSKDDALAAARRADTAASCASADAQRAEAAADGVKDNATSAAASAIAAHKNAQAADASADLAKVNADSAKQSAAAADADKAEVEVIAGDIKKALVDTAGTIVSEEIIDKATAQATTEANAARDTAVASKTAAESAKNAAVDAKTEAESAGNAAAASAIDAKGHADRAKDIVDNLEVSIDDAVPKPIWEDTKLGFKNALGTVVVAPVELKGEKGDKGDVGDKGDKGDIGDTGNAATVAVGFVTALASGSTPTINNTGTQHAAVLDFAIPQGEKGDTPNVSIIAGTGLSGGGDLHADITLDVTYGDSAGTAAQGNHTHAAPTTITGNAGSATKLETARTISLTGDVTGSVSFDGTKNVGIATTLAAGSGATVVSTPVTTLGDFVAIGVRTDFTVTASSLLKGDRSVINFVYSVPKLSINQTLVAINNSASASFTVPSGTSVGSTFTVIIYAVDDIGNRSAEYKKVVPARAASVSKPTIISPVATSAVYNSVIVATSPFSAVGMPDTHKSTDWYLTSDAAGSVIVAQDLDSTNKLSYTFTGLTVADGQTLYAWAVHKGTVLGRSAKSVGVEFVRKKGIIVALGDISGGMYSEGIASTSIDGVTWTVPVTKTGLYSGVVYGAGKYITAVGGAVNNIFSSNRLMYSTDGITWTYTKDIGSPSERFFGSHSSYANDKFVFLGQFGSITSADGIEWAQSVSIDSIGSNIALVYTGSKFVLFRDTGKIYSSTDGIVWSFLVTISLLDTTMKAAAKVAYGNGKFVAALNNIGITTSTDGITWTTPVILGNAVSNYDGLIYAKGKFITLVDNVSSATSEDGITWTAPSKITPESTVWLTLSYADNKFIAGGQQGKITTSPDGITWTTPVVVGSAKNQWRGMAAR